MNKEFLNSHGFKILDDGEIEVLLTNFCNFFHLDKNKLQKNPLFSNLKHKNIQFNVLKLRTLNKDVFLNDKNSTIELFKEIFNVPEDEFFSINVIMI